MKKIRLMLVKTKRYDTATGNWVVYEERVKAFRFRELEGFVGKYITKFQMPTK